MVLFISNDYLWVKVGSYWHYSHTWAPNTCWNIGQWSLITLPGAWWLRFSVFDAWMEQRRIKTFLLHQHIRAAFLKRLLSTWDAAVLSAVSAGYKVAAGAILMTMLVIIES